MAGQHVVRVWARAGGRATPVVGAAFTVAEEAHAPAVRFALPFAGQQVFADDVELQVEVSHFQIPAQGILCVSATNDVEQKEAMCVLMADHLGSSPLSFSLSMGGFALGNCSITAFLSRWPGDAGDVVAHSTVWVDVLELSSTGHHQEQHQRRWR